MNPSRGIFEPQEGFSPISSSRSPFAAAGDAQPASPFAIVSDEKTPFATAPENGFGQQKAADRKNDIFAAAVAGIVTPEARSPFAAAPETRISPPPVPAAVAFAPAEPVPVSQAAAVFSAAPAVAVPATSVSPVIEAAAAHFAEPQPVSAPAPVVAAPPAQPSQSTASEPVVESDSRSIRQLELRAIFGVDRELTVDEMIQRARALPGVRHLSRVPAAEAAIIDSFKRVVSGLGFGAGQVKLYAGSASIDFIREAGVVLAVQTDGGYAPGVRETLIIVARELSRI